MFDGKDPVSGYTEWKTYGEVTNRSRQSGCGTGFYAALFFILLFLHTANELCKAGVHAGAAVLISAAVIVGLYWLYKRLKK